MRVEKVVTLELENSKEEVWYEQRKLVGDVDLESGEVTVVEPPPAEYDELRQHNRDRIDLELLIEARCRAAEARRSLALVAELKQLGTDLARFAAVNDNGPEADLGLAAAVAGAAS